MDDRGPTSEAPLPDAGVRPAEIVLGLLLWPMFAVLDLARDYLFNLRFARAPRRVTLDVDGVVAPNPFRFDEVQTACAWSHQQLSMASGAEEELGVEVRLVNGQCHRFVGFDPSVAALRTALMARGELAPTLKNGGTTGGLGRPAGILLGLVGGALLSALGARCLEG